MLKLLTGLVPLSSSRLMNATTMSLRAASFTIRDLIHETTDDVGTLLTRFAKHIAIEGYKVSPVVPTTIRYPDFFPVTDHFHFQTALKRVSAEQLPALITFAFTYRSNAEPQKFVGVLNDIESAAERLLPEMDAATTLRTLYAFLYLIPNWMTRIDFYRAAVQRLVESNVAANAPKEVFVQLCFYLGLDKRNRKTSSLLQRLLENHLNQHLDNFSTIDLAVVSSAIYKTSTRFPCPRLDELMVKEVLAMPADIDNTALRITFLKAMRFRRIRSDAVCKHLTKLTSKPGILPQMEACGLAHTIAYYAENLWDDDEAIKPLVAEFLPRITQNQFRTALAERLRIKDIGMVLWSCALLNCNLASADLQPIEALLLDRIFNTNEFKYFADQLVDCCLSLWTIGYRSKELLQQSIQVKHQSVNQLRQRRYESKPKVDNRMTVLISAAAIEEPTWVARRTKGVKTLNLNPETLPDYLTENRPDLLAFVKRLQEEKGVKRACLVCPIEGINIAGIMADVEAAPKTQRVFIELLTEQQLLRFSKQPTGLIGLKTRLLQHTGQKVLVLRAKDLQNGYTGLKNLLNVKAVRGDEPAPLQETVASSI